MPSAGDTTDRLPSRANARDELAALVARLTRRVAALEVAKPHAVSVVKVATETVNNSDVLQDDAELWVRVRAGESIQLVAVLYYRAATAADFQVAWGGTATITGRAGLVGLASTVAAVEGDARSSSTPTLGSGLTLGAAGTGTTLTGVATLAATATVAGTVRLRWAQAVARASDADVAAGSFLLGRIV